MAPRVGGGASGPVSADATKARASAANAGRVSDAPEPVHSATRALPMTRAPAPAGTQSAAGGERTACASTPNAYGSDHALTS